MADFVAVIRRAVDGLTENTPAMRFRVYEKARGAVVRQLESMNPRPSEAMFKRQLDKLDDAIRQVEDEHSEALPADEALVENGQPAADGPPAEPVGENMAEPAPEQVAREPEQRDVDDQHASEAVASADQAPAEEARDQPSAQEPADGEPVHVENAGQDAEYQDAAHNEPRSYAEEPVSYHEPSHAAYGEPEPVPAAAVVHEAQAEPEPSDTTEPVVRDAGPADAETAFADEIQQPQQDSSPAQETDDHDDPLLSHFAVTREPALRQATNRVVEEPYVDAENEFPGEEHGAAQAAADDTHKAPLVRDEAPANQPAAAMPDWGVDIDREPEVAAEPDRAPQMPRAALTEADVATDFNDFLKSEFSTPTVKPPPARGEPEGEFSWDAPFDDLPELPKPVAFEQALHARQEELAKAPERKAEGQRDPRAELEDLIGYRSADAGTSADEQGDTLSPEVTRAMSKLEGKSFKIHRKNKQKFKPIPIAFGVVAALVVAGGAFATYTYRDDVSALVANYLPTDAASTKTETRAVEDGQAKSVTADTDVAAATDEAKPTEVASLDNNIAPSKFTQRLLADGTETETDAAKVPVDQSLTEGKTIAGQTVAAQTEVASSDATPVVTGQAAETPGLMVAQKMILYEERLGDSPVAVQGKVTWKLANDTTSTSGKNQPMVEATVEVPERKLKAVVSFKRNSDPSLPASHIIEVVFDLPEDFAEGNVESVQRVAFKQTEQDRGNSLIAVPAKITDDFHMIALNDDADARKVNTELMKTRSWIDIPVIYRNNRRALLTFEKGSTGSDAFDKALAQWAALGPTADNNN